MLQRLAAEVPGLEIGTNLVLLPLHNPVEIAEVGAFLDVLTGGRFLLGVGLGYRPEEFAIFGVPMAERVSRLAEGVEIIRRLWTEDKVTHRGRHWTLRERDDPAAPDPVAAPAHPGRLAGARRHRAGRPHRGRLARGAAAARRRVRGAGARVHRGASRRGADRRRADLPAARGGVRARRGDRDPSRRALPAREVRGLLLVGARGRHARPGRPARGSSSAASRPIASRSARPPRSPRRCSPSARPARPT